MVCQEEETKSSWLEIESLVRNIGNKYGFTEQDTGIIGNDFDARVVKILSKQ